MPNEPPPDFETWWTRECIRLKNERRDTEAYYTRFVMKEILRSAYEAGMRRAYYNEEETS